MLEVGAIRPIAEYTPMLYTITCQCMSSDTQIVKDVPKNRICISCHHSLSGYAESHPPHV